MAIIWLPKTAGQQLLRDSGAELPGDPQIPAESHFLMCFNIGNLFLYSQPHIVSFKPP